MVDIPLTGERPWRNSRMEEAAQRLPRQRFAILDGGQFDDLPALLRRERLFSRSMILDAADREIEKVGAWIVSLEQRPDTVDRVLGLVSAKPAAVFWSCPAGEAALYRHLRKLAMVQLPGGEAVYFRHTDPRVIHCLATNIEASQVAEFYGPATAIMAFGDVFVPPGSA